MNEGQNGPYEFRGLVHKVGELMTFASGFAKRELVLKEDRDSRWPSYGVFEFVRGTSENARDNTAQLEGLRVGETVTVKFFVDGNENRNKPGQFFGSLKGYKVERHGGTAPAPAEPPQDDSLADDSDDIPF